MYLATVIFLLLAVSIQFQVATSKSLLFGIPEALNTGTQADSAEEYREQSDWNEELRRRLILSTIKKYHEQFLPQFVYTISKLSDIKVLFPGLVYAAEIDLVPTTCQVFTTGIFAAEECPVLPGTPAVECHAVYRIGREPELTCRRASPYLDQPTPFLETLPILEPLSAVDIPVPPSVPTVVERLPVSIENFLPFVKNLPVPFLEAAAFPQVKPLLFDEQNPVLNPLPFFGSVPLPFIEPDTYPVVNYLPIVESVPFPDPVPVFEYPPLYNNACSPVVPPIPGPYPEIVPVPKPYTVPYVTLVPDPVAKIVPITVEKTIPDEENMSGFVSSLIPVVRSFPDKESLRVPVEGSGSFPVVEPINVVEPEPALGPVPFPVVVENDSVEETASV